MKCRQEKKMGPHVSTYNKKESTGVRRREDIDGFGYRQSALDGEVSAALMEKSRRDGVQLLGRSYLQSY